MSPLLRPAARRRPRGNPRAEFSALSRTPHRDRTAHHFRFAVSGLERHLSALLGESSPYAGDLLCCTPRHRRPTARRCALSRCDGRYSATPLRPAYPGSRLATRSARAALPDQLRARPALPADFRLYARQRGSIPAGSHCLPSCTHTGQTEPQGY